MHTWKLVAKMSLYIIVSGIISFVSLLDAINVHDLGEISNLDWIKITFKSLLPGLISIKAFLDTTISDNNNSQNNLLTEISNDNLNK